MSTLEKHLHIDIPVSLKQLKTAFSVAALAFEGDLPAAIFHLQLITGNTSEIELVVCVFTSRCCLLGGERNSQSQGS
jgi:hypothetical protein